MNSNLTLWDPPVGVHIHESPVFETKRVAVHFGNYPQPHSTWFMTEADLDMLIKNLLDAKLEYIKGK